MAFLVVREECFTVQCVLTVAPDLVSPQMVKFATSLSRESFVDIEGIVSMPSQPITGASQQVEIQVRNLYCVNKAVPILPINIEDAARSEAEIEKALLIFREYLLSNGFCGIHTPKLIAGSSEGGAAVFRLDYKGTPACLVQSPQLHKQMAICGGFNRVFEIGAVYRAEDSFTHRHLCEFIGLDEAGIEVDPFGDLNTETERKLGQLVLENSTILYHAMPCHDNSKYSNSFDVFIRGEEIISGAQRIHVPEFLTERAQACGIDVCTISTYIDAFRFTVHFLSFLCFLV
ncbi:hypothetical protein SASPL_140956 [Salvia splendens]|uniref:aspartate--tRNA ligase n=1 Tax=Salvia splendens TaxID=180675 RepID=A0A8X8WRA7_SALSN|nr:hypothetical protein SASPL_140956 [Salvia splendens]